VLMYIAGDDDRLGTHRRAWYGGRRTLLRDGRT
jgi:hypothetical protein